MKVPTFQLSELLNVTLCIREYENSCVLQYTTPRSIDQSDTVPPAVLADVNEAMPTLKYILPMPGVAYFALKPVLPTVSLMAPKASEFPRMLTFMVFLELGAHLFDASPTFDHREHHPPGVTVDDFFCTLFDPVGVRLIAWASLPRCTAFVAELCGAAAAVKASQSVSEAPGKVE